MRSWLVLQLADSAFPTGGFAHSGGLEVFVQLGEVRDGEELASFLDQVVWQAGFFALPFVRAGWFEPSALARLDAEMDAFLTNPVTNRASRTQGRAFVATAARIFGGPELDALHEASRSRTLLCHHAPAFGACLRLLGLDEDTTPRLYLHGALRTALSAAVRLGLVGPHEGQAIQHARAALLERVVERCRSLSLDEAAQTAPLVDLFGAKHDALYSKLFQS